MRFTLSHPLPLSSRPALPGRDKPASTAWVRDPGLEEVRHAMLQSLAGMADSEVARMNMRLRYASDIEALWYLRADLFSLLLPRQGEDGARRTMDALTALFQGQLPHALRPLNIPAQGAGMPQKV